MSPDDPADVTETARQASARGGPVTVSVDAGVLRGRTVEGGVRRFLGVPYAEPPVGERRFRLPVRRRRFEGTFDAGEYGPTAPHLVGQGPTLLPDRTAPGDDYLNLNVWAPPGGGDHPVIVFIHGGGWWSGSGSVGGYDGSRFARDGVVLVTINYRLGAEGLIWFGSGPANLSLRDQICALEWVQDNIAAFGGDPGNVTVCGESSGAMSIGALITMPASQGLIRRAIMESGSTFHSISADSARKTAVQLARLLHVEPTLEALSAVPQDELVAAQDRLREVVQKSPRRSTWGDVAVNGLPFEPVVDGESLPAPPIESLRAGVAADIDLLVGWNAEEAQIVLAPMGADRVRSWMLPLYALQKGLPPLRAVRTYRRAFPGASAAPALGALLTDWIYRVPAIRTAEAHENTRVYEFAWRSPALDGTLGAAHAAELPFVFDNLDHPDWQPLLAGGGDQRIADEVHRAWADFARTGDPGWPRYSVHDRQVHRFDAPSATLLDPDPARRVIWDGRR
ncbi:carboxylesterase family protein [Microbacterium betulae]|uniref:Carboxylic ester hydrolase n=1 Tax=Microbacterium betulae TaxID=2981139 RepID=A0AA97I3N6_9MICO|nr:carboxylesterase family protein [Microbacterium sp. AB]WOF21646.1 carboxylesterase family protein [Microbacterium sp. AB]